MNAQFAAMAAGTINANGCIFNDSARAAKTGSIIVAVAVLDVNSVSTRTSNAESAIIDDHI